MKEIGLHTMGKPKHGMFNRRAYHAALSGNRAQVTYYSDDSYWREQAMYARQKYDAFVQYREDGKL